MGHATADNVAAAMYVKEKFPDMKGYTGINQNYAWGQDSWRDFDLTLQQIMPNTKASDKTQFPKIFAGQYGSEISAMSLDKADLIHTSFWGGDLEAFIFQGNARGTFQEKNWCFHRWRNRSLSSWQKIAERSCSWRAWTIRHSCERSRYSA